MAHAHIEPLIGILRVFHDDSSFGDPFDWVATLRWIDRDTVEICGVMRSPLPSEWRAIREVMDTAGVKVVNIQRRRDDGKTETKRLYVASRRKSTK